ncbi:MAG: sulfite exporter TauE/SafE family protein [Synergistaceae bacterium]|nr:sulfite exporter TauE/SafE family protein [Synergistaceae bacterium]
MTLVHVILLLVVLVNGAFAILFIRDLIKHKGEVKAELFENTGKTVVQAVVAGVTFFLSTFGISDFAISTVVFRQFKWVDDTRIPGTLNTECVIPVAIMALAYISSIDVELTTLLLCIGGQVVGAYIGPRFVVKMNVDTIKKFICVGLLIASGLILMNKFGVYPSGGEALGLHGPKLALAAVLSLVYGALNNVGIGSYALTMATVYALGLNPNVAFPIMMGGCTFSVPVGSMQFVKYDSYSRKITLLTSTIGLIGVLVAVYIVKNLDVSALQWVVAAVILYAAVSLIYELAKKGGAKTA